MAVPTTPAHAGTTRSLVAWAIVPYDHPRAHGDHHQAVQLVIHGDPITPAHTGTTTTRYLIKGITPDHPLEHGDY